MRLIDADRLSEAIYDNVPAPYEDASWAKENCLAEIEAAQTVDAVPVVRCRECKHFRHYGKTSLFINGKNIKAGWCQRRISYDEEYRMTADDFCSYGERKEGANNDGEC